VGLVDDDEIPADRLEFIPERVREVEGKDQDGTGLERVPAFTPGLAARLGIQDNGRKTELLLQLERPLLANGGWADHEQATTTLSPILAENDAGLNRLPKSNLVGQHHALRERRLQSEQRGLDLMGVQVDGGIEERHGQAVEPASRAARQVVSEVLRVVGGEAHQLYVARSWASQWR
jgi:hypothetical protein